MNYTKINELNGIFSNLQVDIDKCIVEQLKRIGRTVTMQELDITLFREDIQPYVQAIKLDTENNTIFETSFCDVKEKRLEAFVMDYEMSLEDLIILMNYLADLQE